MKILLPIFFLLLLQLSGLAYMGKVPDHIKYHSNEEIPEDVRKRLASLDFGYKQFSIDRIGAEFDRKKKTYTEACVTISLPREKLYQEFVSFYVYKRGGDWHLNQPPRGSHSLKLSGEEKMFSRRFRFDHMAFKPADIVEIINILRKGLEDPPEGANFGPKSAERFLSMIIDGVWLRNESIRVELRDPEGDSQRKIFFSLQKVDGSYDLDPLYGITIESL